MSKIDDFKARLGRATSLRAQVQHGLGRDSASNDKHRVCVNFTGLAPGMFNPMKFEIDLEYGYYGSSSGYSATSQDLGLYLARSIQKHAAILLDTAVDLAEQDAETARKAAEIEARSVLEAVK